MAAHRKLPPKEAAEAIRNLAAQGFSMVGIAMHFKVSSPTVKRWLDEDEVLQEAFEMGRETERQYLHSLVVQSAAAGRAANVNAFFLLKARHGYREQDSPNSSVNVGVQVSSVMVVKDHGTDEEWEARAAEQQRKLTIIDAPRSASLALEAPQSVAEPLPIPEQQPIPAKAPDAAWMPPSITNWKRNA